MKNQGKGKTTDKSPLGLGFGREQSRFPLFAPSRDSFCIYSGIQTTEIVSNKASWLLVPNHIYRPHDSMSYVPSMIIHVL